MDHRCFKVAARWHSPLLPSGDLPDTRYALGELNAVYLLLGHGHRNFPLYDSAMPASPLEIQLQPRLLDHTHARLQTISPNLFLPPCLIGGRLEGVRTI